MSLDRQQMERYLERVAAYRASGQTGKGMGRGERRSDSRDREMVRRLAALAGAA